LGEVSGCDFSSCGQRQNLFPSDTFRTLQTTPTHSTAEDILFEEDIGASGFSEAMLEAIFTSEEWRRVVKINVDVVDIQRKRLKKAWISKGTD